MEWFSFTTSSVINVTDVSLNDQVRAPTQRSTALAIQGAIGTGSDNNFVDDITHSFSGQDLTLTLSRSGGLIDLFEVITIPSTGGGTGTDDQTAAEVTVRCKSALHGQSLAALTDDYRRCRRRICNAINALTLGGGGTAGPVIAYKANLSSVTVADADSDLWNHVVEIDTANNVVK